MNAILIGRGYWGGILENYIRNSKHFKLLKVFGKDFQKVDIPKHTHIAFIATPLDSHFYLAMQCLQAKLHVFIEKPTCKNIYELETLYKEAQKYDLRIYTDYIYLTSPSINKIAELLPTLGDLKTIQATITQYGKFYKNENVIEIIGIHWISVMVYLFHDVWVYNYTFNEYETTIYLQHATCNIEIYSSLITHKKARILNIYGKNAALRFDMLATPPLCLTSNHNKQEFQYDETHNINHTLESFCAILHDKTCYNKHVQLCQQILSLSTSLTTQRSEFNV